MNITYALCREILGSYLNLEVTDEIGAQAELELYEKWVRSRETDFSIYDDTRCLLWLIKFWPQLKGHLRLSIKWLKKYGIKADTILDYSCGCGFSSLMLANEFPDATIIGSNLPGEQFEFNRYLEKAQKLNNLKFLEEGKYKGEADIIFSMEVFEHIKEPLLSVDKLIDKYNPPVIVESHSFTVKSPGHYDVYLFNGKEKRGYASRAASIAFTKGMKIREYSRANTSFWNARPNIWIKSISQ